MKEIALEEIKQIELNLLKEFDKFCGNNDLKYYLADGTLLGGVRHNGFIPWDDDIDIWMMQDDYCKMQKIFAERNNNSFMSIKCPNEKNAVHPYVKIYDNRTLKIEDHVRYVDNSYLGIDIDVFPLDIAPNSAIEFQKYYRKLIRVYKIFLYNVLEPKTYDIKWKVFLSLCQTISNEAHYYYDLAEKLKNRARESSSSEYVCSICSCFDSIKRIYKKEWFADTVLIKFEDAFFPAPFGYKEVLKNNYGDWSILPPEKERVSHHSYKAFWK